jgi:hypothetical protein
MTKKDIIELVTKLYQRKKNGWFIVGYKCPYCDKHYFTLNNPLIQHVKKCTGKKPARNLED